MYGLLWITDYCNCNFLCCPLKVTEGEPDDEAESANEAEPAKTESAHEAESAKTESAHAGEPVEAESADGTEAAGWRDSQQQTGTSDRKYICKAGRSGKDRRGYSGKGKPQCTGAAVGKAGGAESQAGTEVWKDFK